MGVQTVMPIIGHDNPNGASEDIFLVEPLQGHTFGVIHNLNMVLPDTFDMILREGGRGGLYEVKLSFDQAIELMRSLSIATGVRP